MQQFLSRISSCAVFLDGNLKQISDGMFFVLRCSFRLISISICICRKFKNKQKTFLDIFFDFVVCVKFFHVAYRCGKSLYYHK